MSTSTEWQDLRLRLRALKDSIAEEIRHYPPPIPACDAQFNHLVEQRRALSQELARLDTAERDASGSIEDFLNASPCRQALEAAAKA